MSTDTQRQGSPAYWFVGASWDDGDQTDRFIREGIWQNGFEDKLLDEVRSIAIGDRIAIKSVYTRKTGLPFENNGNLVSTMAIKAIGTVTGNAGDGKTVQVNWTRVDPPREWYFYTFRGTLWHVTPKGYTSSGLVRFAFENEPQDIQLFRDDPFWRDRYGDPGSSQRKFAWTRFYEAFADKLLEHRHDRRALVAAVHEMAGRLGGAAGLQDKFADGSSGPLKDICPFTTFGLFNRGIREATRINIAADLGRFLGVEVTAPTTFDGIPILNNQNTWFFSFHEKRGPDDIDKLWNVFAAALEFSQGEETEETRTRFVDDYDAALQVRNVAWNLTTGLYWIRPWDFLTLDGQSREYIEDVLKIKIERTNAQRHTSGRDYLSMMDVLEERFRQDSSPVHSYPELSLAAWVYKPATEPADPKPEPPDSVPGPVIQEPEYTLDSIHEEGCFIERPALAQMLDRLKSKKNLILQGPPGTGKTWLAKRLGYALIGERDKNRVLSVQFHPNLSYEDFIRGWRPTGEGKLELVDGPFMQMVNAALEDSERPYVVVIEEINRGNPVQVLGEMLTLLEADKRRESEAMALCHSRSGGERVYIPDNLYVIGTMNIADRSLALVDLALRRRFAFVELEPMFGERWQSWVQKTHNLEKALLQRIEQRVLELNHAILADTTLGRQFRIGHAFLTPGMGFAVSDARAWFRQIVETEIGPLLDEYWFDALEKAAKEKQRLLEDL